MSFFQCVFDENPLSLEVSVKQEPSNFMDCLIPMSDQESCTFESSLFCPELDDMLSIDSSDSSTSSLPTPPGRSLGSTTMCIKREEDNYFAPPNSLYSDFLGQHEEPDFDWPALRKIGRTIRPKLPTPTPTPTPSTASPSKAASSTSQLEPQDQDQGSLPIVSRHRVFSRHIMPCVLPCQPLDDSDWVECSEANDKFKDSAGRVFRVHGWSPPDNNKYPFANICLEDLALSSAANVSILAAPGQEHENEKVQESAPGGEVQALSLLDGKLTYEKAEINGSLDRPARTRSAVSKVSATKPQQTPGSKKKWARRYVAGKPAGRKRRATARSETPTAVLPAAPPDVVQTGFLSTVGSIQPLLFAESASVPSVEWIPALDISTHLSNDATLSGVENSTAPFCHSQRRPSSESSSRPPYDVARVYPIEFTTGGLELVTQLEQSTVPAQSITRRPRLKTMLEPCIARSITRRGREAREEESLRERSRIEEELRQFEVSMQQDEKEEERKLLNEYLDFNAGKADVEVNKVEEMEGEQAGQAGGEGDNEGDVKSGLVEGECVYKLTMMNSLGLRPPHSFHGLEYSDSTRRRALGRSGSFPGADNGFERVTDSLDIPTQLTRSLCRTLSESSAMQSRPGALSWPSLDSVPQRMAKRGFEGDNAESFSKRPRLT